MKNLLKNFLLLVTIAAIAGITSCTKVCDLGYEGDHCVTPVRTKFIGTFSGRQTCGSATDTFSVAFTEVSNDVTKIRITNAYNAGLNTYGTVLENGSIAIASQASGTANISGSLTMSGGKINLSYLVSGGGLPDDNCGWVQN